MVAITDPGTAGQGPSVREGLKQQVFIFSRIRRLEVQDQGVGRFGFFRTLYHWPADGFPYQVRLWSSPHTCIPGASVCPDLLIL